MLYINKKTKFANLFCLCLMFESVFYLFNSDKYFQISGFPVFLILGIVFGLLCILKIILKKKLSSISGCSLFLVVILVLECFVNSSNFSTGYFFSYLIFLIILVLLDNITFSEKNIIDILFSYLFGAFIISLVILIFRKRYYELEVTRLTIKIGQNDVIDPNYLGIFLVAPIFIGIRIMQNQKTKKKKFWILFMTSIVALGVFLTGSRGAILSVVCGVFIIFLHSISRRIKRRTLIFIVVGIIVGVILVYLFIPIETVLRFVQIKTWSDSSNNRRIQLWMNAISAIIKHPVLGLGVGDTAQSIGLITGVFEPCHNTYLEIWAHTGVLGLILFLLIFLKLYIKQNKYIKAIILSTLVFSIFVSAEATFAFWMNIYCSLIMSKSSVLGIKK